MPSLCVFRSAMICPPNAVEIRLAGLHVWVAGRVDSATELADGVGLARRVKCSDLGRSGERRVSAFRLRIDCADAVECRAKWPGQGILVCKVTLRLSSRQFTSKGESFALLLGDAPIEPSCALMVLLFRQKGKDHVVLVLKIKSRKMRTVVFERGARVV